MVKITNVLIRKQAVFAIAVITLVSMFSYKQIP